jgi:hypothetical protein
MACNNSQAQSFFNDAYDVTQEVFSQIDHASHYDISLAGLRVRLSFAGENLPPLIIPALTHLLNSNSACEPEFTVLIWDTYSGGVNLPKFSGKVSDIKFRGEIEGLNSERFYAAHFSHANLLSVYDAEQKLGIICTSNPFHFPAFEVACPVRAIISWILQSNGRSLVHAAAIGTDNGAVLLGGDSGAGKSSTALRGLLNNMYYFGDDICGIENLACTSIVHSIYSSAKIHKYDESKFSPLISAKAKILGIEEHEKQIYFLSPSFDSQLKLSAQIKAILIPDHSVGPMRMELISTGLAASLIGSSTNSLLPRSGIETIKVVANTARNVPCIRFHLGPDPFAVAPAIADFLNS